MADVNYSVVFDFEKNFDHSEFHRWFTDNWTLSLWISAVYVVVIFGVKYYMEHRQRYDLRPLLALWSAILAIFSIAGLVRTLPEFIFAMANRSFHYSVCNPSFFSGVAGFWVMMFTCSKVFELGDTIFIVLRKQKLIFLHWYHHITVMIYCFYTYKDQSAPGRWFMVMNYMVHSFMYSYYTLKALRVKVPRWVNVAITSMQLLQMTIGTAIPFYVYNAKSQGLDCQQTDDNMRYTLIMYLSYFVLFGHFFYCTYIAPTRKTMDVKKSQ